VPAHASVVLEAGSSPVRATPKARSVTTPLLHAHRAFPGAHGRLHDDAGTPSHPIFQTIVVGRPPQEDAWIGKATERIFLPLIRLTLPELVDYDLPVAGGFHNCVIRVDRTSASQARARR